MKKWYHLLCLLILTSFALYGQNVYQHFSELNGMEDYNGNTNLLYRIFSSKQDSTFHSYDNSIFLVNAVNKMDSLFQVDYAYSIYYSGGQFRTVYDYDFWEMNPEKFIVCGSFGYDDGGSPLIERFDNYRVFLSLIGDANFIGISRQNDSLVYYTINNGLFCRSTDGGFSWDTTGYFNAFSLSPYNDKVLFSIEDHILKKTTDGGLTKFVVDTIPSNDYRSEYMLTYDKDSNYIYRIGYYYLQFPRVRSFLVSNNSGESNSWNVKLTSPLPIYVSIDYSLSGSVFLATGRYIYHSTDFGNTFNLFQTFDRNLVGIYKKPGSTKLYAAIYNTIYEIDGSTINIIKQIPIDKEIFKFDPLEIGNKWVYQCQFMVPEETIDFVSSREIIKDTTLANQQTFKQIKSISLNSYPGHVTYSYERIDLSNGKVYFWNTNSASEYLVDDLSLNLGDTIDVSRFVITQMETSFDSLNTKSIIGLTKENHVFNSSDNPLGYGDRYSLTKDIGLTSRFSSNDQVLTTWNLKGAIIKGVVYGDTSFVVGINDKFPTQPHEFVLSQNYPNPFNPSTTINYSIPKPGNVKLTIYNAIGSKVATIVNEYKPVGNYSVQFNASYLASGIYLYRLESGNYSIAKKFILLK